MLYANDNLAGREYASYRTSNVFNKTISDIASFADSFIKLQIKNFLSIITISDSKQSIATLIRSFSETVSISSALKRYKNALGFLKGKISKIKMFGRINDL